MYSQNQQTYTAFVGATNSNYFKVPEYEVYQVFWWNDANYENIDFSYLFVIWDVLKTSVFAAVKISIRYLDIAAFMKCRNSNEDFRI